MKNNQIVRLSIIGNIYIGKSTLIHFIKENQFFPSLPVGVAPDFISIKYRFNGRDINLQIIDMHGSCLQDQNQLSINFIKNCQSVIVAFSFDDDSSLDSVNHWLNRCKETVKEQTPILIVGTKRDTITDDILYKKKRDKINTKIQSIIEGYNNDGTNTIVNIIRNKEDYFFPVSSKSGEGVTELVKIWVSYGEKNSRDPQSIILSKDKKKKKGCC